MPESPAGRAPSQVAPKSRAIRAETAYRQPSTGSQYLKGSGDQPPRRYSQASSRMSSGGSSRQPYPGVSTKHPVPAAHGGGGLRSTLPQVHASGSDGSADLDPATYGTRHTTKVTGWYPVDSDIVIPYTSPHRYPDDGVYDYPSSSVHVIEEDPGSYGGPPAFLSEQWGGHGEAVTATRAGWVENASQLQTDVVTGSLYVASMELMHVPAARRRALEHKAALDVARLFDHPPRHVAVTLEPGSIVVRYRLELPDPGPSAVSVLSRAAAEMSRENVRLPELEREYRNATGNEVAAQVNYGRCDAPCKGFRARPLEGAERDHTPQGKWPESSGPVEQFDIEGRRKMEAVGLHKTFDGSRVWPDLPALPPALRADCQPPPVLSQCKVTATKLPSLGEPVPSASVVRSTRFPANAPGALDAPPSPIHAAFARSVSPPAFPATPLRQPSAAPPSHHPYPAQHPQQQPFPPVCDPTQAPVKAFQSGHALTPPEVQAVRAKLAPFLADREQQYAAAGKAGDAVAQSRILGSLGERFHEEGDHESAILYHTRQLELLPCLENFQERVAETAKVCSMLGNSCWALGKWEQALTYHQRRLEIAESQADKRGIGAAYGNLGNVYHSMGDYRAAIQYHLRHQTCVHGDDMETMGAVYHNLGLAQYGLGDIDAALDSFRHALEITISLGNHAQAARIHGSLAMCYKARDKLQECVNELHLQLKAEIKLSDGGNAAGTSFSLGNIYVSQGDYKSALQYYERGVDLFNWHAHANPGMGRTRLGAKLLIACASCKYHTGRHKEAMDDAKKALQLATEGVEDLELQAAAHSNLGLCYQMLEDTDAALKHHQAHLGIARMMGNLTAEGTAHGNLGNVYKTRGEQNKAIDHFERDLSIALETGDVLAQGQAYDNLGLSCQKLGEYTLAVEYHAKALLAMQQLQYKAGEAEANAHLGAAYEKLGELKLAIQHHHTHLELSKTMKDLEGQARACSALGRSCFDFGMTQKAAEYQTLRLKLVLQLKDPIAEARACGNLFLCYAALGDHLKADAYMKQHRKLCAQHGIHTIEETEDGVCHIRFEIAQALRDKADTERATHRLAVLAQRMN
ncbi:UDP-N-acetylglucosamine--peptide N-acetylglucosaminyltransferase [Diplonema papillatum]|nr:UDP-N-acetylglucosamine--peptide N-acetylglucosaminyltransferase [Diplonema papillatum]